MASIQRRDGKNGLVTYRIMISNGFDEKGKRKMETFTYKPKAKSPQQQQRQVELHALKLQEQIKEAGLIGIDKLTLAQVTDIWRENWLCNKTPAVQEKYYETLQRMVLPKLGKRKVTQINPIHIDTIMHGMKAEGYAPSTIKYVFTCINSVMRYAEKKRFVKQNPCLRCDDRPTVQKDKQLHFFTLEQAKIFLNALTWQYETQYKSHERKLKKYGTGFTVESYKERHTIPFQWRPYFDLAIKGGFRRGELCALTWQDIDFQGKTISVNKSMSQTKQKGIFIKSPKTAAGERILAMGDGSFRLLRQWKQKQKELSLMLGTAWEGYRGKDYDKNNVFIQLDSGKPMHLNTPSHKFIEILDMYNNSCTEDKDKLPRIHLHDLRHTCATLQVAQRMDIATVSHRLGHNSIQTTLVNYTHAIPANDKEAAEIVEAMFQ